MRMGRMGIDLRLAPGDGEGAAPAHRPKNGGSSNILDAYAVHWGSIGLDDPTKDTWRPRRFLLREHS